MPSWLMGILTFLLKLATGVFVEAAKTPAVEEEVLLEEGDLIDPDPSEYDGLYGVHDRDQGEADTAVDLPSANS